MSLPVVFLAKTSRDLRRGKNTAPDALAEST
jgi:hypothetical protein